MCTTRWCAVTSVAALSFLPIQACSAEPAARWAVHIVFGSDDKEPTDWSGRIAGPAAVLERIRLEPWRFAQGDSLPPRQAAWKAQTRMGISPLERMPVGGTDQPPARQTPWPIGVTLIGTGPEPDRLEVETVRGNFDVNVRDLAWGIPQTPLAGVRVERTVAPTTPVARPDNDPHHDDSPALLVTRSGEHWLAWIAYRDAQDEILLARDKGDGWSEAEVISPGGDHAGVALAQDAAGHIWAVWSQQVGGNWDIYARHHDGEKWSERTRLSDDPGPDIHPAAASSPDGSVVVVVWQGFRDGQSDIFLRSLSGEKPATYRVSESPANDWMPAVCVDSGGTAHVAWDGYDAGNYDVFLRSVNPRRPAHALSAVRKIAGTVLAETQPSIACDDRGRVWIAYDEGTAAWGKDYGFWWWTNNWPQGTRLYEARRFRVVCSDGDRVLEPADPFATLPREFQEYSEQPMVRVDAQGAPWILFRHRTAKNPRADGWAAAGWWELYAIRSTGDAWTSPIPFPRSMGRQSQPSSAAVTPRGLAVAWATDGRTFQQPADGIRTRVWTAEIESRHAEHAAAPPVLGPRRAPDLGGIRVKNVHEDEPGDLRRIRQYRVRAGDKKLAIYRGDLHRHTEISGDGVGDGTLTDLYRYALDAAAFDYCFVSDHGMGSDRAYPWWRTQKSNDLFYLAGRFVPLYGYERSIKYPWGHRNVIWARRGHPTFPTTRAPGTPAAKGGPQPADDDTRQLYAHLRKTGGIATSHTSATDQGTDWETGFDPELEPVVEIFQGYHTSYEGPGTPLAVAETSAIVHGAFRPAGFIWNALDKGYRLGFQASSDHIATHTSYACILAESLDRDALFDALKKRHSYAATDNIVLDVRSGDHIMGDDFTADGPTTLEAVIHGTAPLAQIDVVRNREVVYSHDAGQARRAEFRWTDMDPPPGTNYYYVRVEQSDHQMAWASPIWVRRK